MEIGVLVGAGGKYNYMWFLKYDEVRGMIYCNYSIRITYFGYAENENKYNIIHIHYINMISYFKSIYIS